MGNIDPRLARLAIKEGKKFSRVLRKFNSGDKARVVEAKAGMEQIIDEYCKNVDPTGVLYQDNVELFKEFATDAVKTRFYPHAVAYLTDSIESYINQLSIGVNNTSKPAALEKIVSATENVCAAFGVKAEENTVIERLRENLKGYNKLNTTEMTPEIVNDLAQALAEKAIEKKNYSHLPNDLVGAAKEIDMGTYVMFFKSSPSIIKKQFEEDYELRIGDIVKEHSDEINSYCKDIVKEFLKSEKPIYDIFLGIATLTESHETIMSAYDSTNKK